MTILDPCMSLERIKKKVVLGVVDMRQILFSILSKTNLGSYVKAV